MWQQAVDHEVVQIITAYDHHAPDSDDYQQVSHYQNYSCIYHYINRRNSKDTRQMTLFKLSSTLILPLKNIKNT